jgi:hypothetical protein
MAIEPGPGVGTRAGFAWLGLGPEGGDDMTRALRALFALVALGTLIYTIGAPHYGGG